MQFMVNDVALKAIKLIEKKGFDAYVVGGAVRDFF